MYYNADPKPSARIKPVKALKKKLKPTGEKLVFGMIAQARPHICQICKKPLKGELCAGNFMHLVGKGTRPDLRLNPKNILLSCFSIDGNNCHSKYDTEAESVLLQQDYAMWKPVFDKRDKMKEIN